MYPADKSHSPKPPPVTRATAPGTGPGDASSGQGVSNAPTIASILSGIQDRKSQLLNQVVRAKHDNPGASSAIAPQLLKKTDQNQQHSGSSFHAAQLARQAQIAAVSGLTTVNNSMNHPVDSAHTGSPLPQGGMMPPRPQQPPLTAAQIHQPINNSVVIINQGGMLPIMQMSLGSSQNQSLTSRVGVPLNPGFGMSTADMTSPSLQSSITQSIKDKEQAEFENMDQELEEFCRKAVAKAKPATSVLPVPTQQVMNAPAREMIATVPTSVLKEFLVSRPTINQTLHGESPGQQINHGVGHSHSGISQAEMDEFTRLYQLDNQQEQEQKQKQIKNHNLKKRAISAPPPIVRFSQAGLPQLVATASSVAEEPNNKQEPKRKKRG